MKHLLLLAPLALAACGGHSTDTLTYGGHELEPNSIIFARVPIEAGEFTVALISDRGDACVQFDGLACLQQPQVLEVDQSEDEKEFGGTFDLVLPQGPLKGEFTADFCKPMRAHMVGSSRHEDRHHRSQSRHRPRADPPVSRPR